MISVLSLVGNIEIYNPEEAWCMKLNAYYFLISGNLSQLMLFKISVYKIWA